MAYIGPPAPNRFVAPKAASVFSGDGSTTAFTLDHAVGSDEDILVSVDGVIQEPSVAYAVSSGTTLTFTAAPSNNSGNNIFVYYLFRTVGTVSHPSNNALEATSGTFTGDLTVDTSTLKVDSTNNRVGIGFASPATPLDIRQTNTGADTGIRVYNLDNSNTTTQTASLFLSPDSRSNGALISSLKENADMSTSAGRDVSLVFSPVQNNTQTERMRITSAGNVIVSSNEPTLFLKDSNNANTTRFIKNSAEIFTIGRINDDLSASSVEHLRIDGSGDFYIGSTNNAPAQSNIAGALAYRTSAQLEVNGNNTGAASFGRTDDGRVIDIYSAGTREGSIDVSGTAVSLAGAHLSRWSRLVGGGQPSTLLRGTVMSNLDEMVEWSHEAVLWTDEDELPDGVSVGDVKKSAYTEDNEQLNHTKVSDVESDVNVAGVFQSWDSEDNFDDYYLAMTGDFVIRIAQGTTVARGDLLMSAGDGTAKPQDDDIVRSKTIAKVTSTNVSHTYDDGSYLVPCVLMAC